VTATIPENSATSFVLLQLDSRRFALSADIVTELAPPVRLHSFPHTASMLSGVIVRRGRIVPVYDASSVLMGKRSSAHRFYLIARREFGKLSELSAIPVDGDCELATGELQPREAGQPAYVKGRLPVGDELIDVLDFEALVADSQAAADGTNRVEVLS
jgi:chemotaxis signal transduction protein